VPPPTLLFRLSVNRVRRRRRCPRRTGAVGGEGGGEDTAALRVVTVVGRGTSVGAGGGDGVYVTRDKNPTARLYGDVRAPAQWSNGE